MRRSTFARRDAAHDVCAVLDHLFSVKRALFARDALHDETRIFINENTQRFLPLQDEVFLAWNDRAV